jgi:hypothetical protein
LAVCTNRKSTFFTFAPEIAALDPPVLLCEEAQPVSPLDAIMPASTPDRMTNCFVFMSFNFF